MSLRVAIIGAGAWASRFHAPAVSAHPRAELVAVCDPDPAAASRMAQRHGGSTYSHPEELIAHEDFDCAIIATPHATHSQIAGLILSSGRHVFIEKPLATSAVDAFSLLDLASRSKLTLSVGYTSQYSPAATTVRDWVRSDIGELVQVSIEFSSRAGALFAAGDDDPATTYSAQNGGGQGRTQLTHAIAMLSWVTGMQFESVAALTAARGLGVDVVDVAAFRLEGGALGVASSTGTLSSQLDLTQRLKYIGEHGVIEQDILLGKATLQRADGTLLNTVIDHLLPPYPASEPVRAFLDLVLGEGPNLSPPEPAAAAVAFIEAMYESAASGNRVDVPQLPRSIA